MIDRTTPLQVPGRMADLHVEARARRLEAEARAHAGTVVSGERMPWLMDRVHAVRGAAVAVVGRVRPTGVRTGPVLTPSRHRA
jgi:hypothetical protein